MPTPPHPSTVLAVVRLAAPALVLGCALGVLGGCGGGEGGAATGNRPAGVRAGAAAPASANGPVSPVYARQLLLQISRGEKRVETLTPEERRAVAAVAAAQRGN